MHNKSFQDVGGIGENAALQCRIYQVWEPKSLIILEFPDSEHVEHTIAKFSTRDRRLSVINDIPGCRVDLTVPESWNVPEVCCPYALLGDYNNDCTALKTVNPYVERLIAELPLAAR